jgi:hypothetical protein
MTDSLSKFRQSLVEYLSVSDLDHLDVCCLCEKPIPDDESWRCVLREPYEGIKLGIEHYLMAHVKCAQTLPRGGSVAYARGETKELHKKYRAKPASIFTTIKSIEKPEIVSYDGGYKNYFTQEIKRLVDKKTTPFRSKKIQIFVELYLGDALVYMFDEDTKTLKLTFFAGLRMGGGHLDWDEVAILL